jgi:hypothetical protein
LALLAAELVEPYVSIFQVNKLTLSDDVVPSSKPREAICRKTKKVMVAKNSEDITIEWAVGGSMTVDNTELWYAKLDDISVDQLHCMNQPTSMDGFKKGKIIGPSSGTGYYSKSGASPSDVGSSEEQPNGPIFKGTITIPAGLKTMDQLVVIASAKVDQDWTNMPADYKPDLPPQSHIVNARTNPDWHHHSAGKHVKGRLYWFSRPLMVVIGDFDGSIGTQAGHLVETLEVNPRIGNIDGGILPKFAGKQQLWFPVNLIYILLVVVLGLTCCMCYLSKRNSNQAFSLADGEDYDDDGFVFDSKPYSDENKSDPNELELSPIS